MSSRWLLVGLLTIAACGRNQDPDADATKTGTEPASIPPPSASSETSTEEPPRLAEVRVHDLTPSELRPEDFTTSVDELVVAELGRDFERVEDDPRACRAAIGIGYALLVNRRPVVRAEAGEARAMLEGELFCPRPGSPPGSTDVDAYQIKLDARRSFGGSAGGTGPDRLTEALRSVARDGGAALYGQLRMRHASDEQLRRTLAGSAHPGLLAEAASEAGERDLTDTAGDLVRLTAHANPRVATRAGAALGLLKVSTPEVIRALVAMTKGSDSDKHLVAIHALADLGTEDAKRYLENLAVGHPSLILREIARERLSDLGHRAPPEPAPE